MIVLVNILREFVISVVELVSNFIFILMINIIVLMFNS